MSADTMPASQLSLFSAANPQVSPVTVANWTTEELERKAMAAIDAVLEAGHPLICAWSSGKDSSVVAMARYNSYGFSYPVSSGLRAFFRPKSQR
jgi:hypothetical protein